MSWLYIGGSYRFVNDGIGDPSKPPTTAPQQNGTPQAPAAPQQNGTNGIPAPPPPPPGPNGMPPLAPGLVGPDGKPWAHHGPSSGFSFGNLDNTGDLQYANNQQMGYQKLMDWANPHNSSSNYGSWLAGQYGETANRYAAAAADQGPDAEGHTLKWVDYLEKVAPGFRDQFNALSARQRGENPALYDSGVYLG